MDILRSNDDGVVLNVTHDEVSHEITITQEFMGQRWGQIVMSPAEWLRLREELNLRVEESGLPRRFWEPKHTGSNPVAQTNDTQEAGTTMSQTKRLVIVVLVVVAGLFFYNRTPDVPTPPDDRPVPNVPDDRPVPPPVKPKFTENAKSFEEALQMSELHKVPVLLYFWRPGCPWCDRMKETFADDEVNTRLDDFIRYPVNTNSERELAQKYGIKGLPSLRLVDETGNTTKEGSGFMEPQKFLSWLNGSEDFGMVSPLE